jgi:hypothetical protein
MRLTLKDDGYPFKKIMRGKTWIGRVVRMGDGSGRYLGRIGGHEFTASTELDAFEGVAARFMGFDSAGDLRQQNAIVRQRNRASRQAGKWAAEEALRGNFEPLMKALARGRQ